MDLGRGRVGGRSGGDGGNGRRWKRIRFGKQFGNKSGKSWPLRTQCPEFLLPVSLGSSASEMLRLTAVE